MAVITNSRPTSGINNMISYLMKCAPGDVRNRYIDVRFLAKTQEYNDGADWEVWLMYNADVDQDGNPTFQPKPGDEILGGWWRYRENQIAVPEHPDLFEYVRPIGNLLNEATATYDGTPDFAYYANGMGAPSRWWGNTNPSPDDNQSRHVECFRYTTEFGGQTYHRVRFILQPPFDKDNAPNALAILIYTDPQRQNYFYTPGAFIWESTYEYWYADTTIGQSPTSGPEHVYYCVALGSAPLNGGGTVPAVYNEPRTEQDFDAGVPTDPEQESFNWDANLSAAQQALPNDVALAALQERAVWLNFNSIRINTFLIIQKIGWVNQIIVPWRRLLNNTHDIPKPGWMSDGDYLELLAAIEKATGRSTINASP